MKVYYLISHNNFIAIICVTVLLFMLCGQLKTILTPAPQDGATNAERVDYLLSLGYEVDETPVNQKQSVIPRKFGEAYEEYLLEQAEAGFPLEDYKGQNVSIFDYRDRNGEIITLIVSQNEIIGAHLTDKETAEFKPLKKKEK